MRRYTQTKFMSARIRFEHLIYCHIWSCLAVLSLVSFGVDSVSAQTAEFLSNIRQLTFGGQNAEAYWSPSGEKLVFQATRDGNRCDQIYVMNADGSDLRMVSTGKGVTTCGYFLPGDQEIVYASTHESVSICPPRPDRSQGYVWPIHEGYEIYRVRIDGSGLQKLTESKGYDAETTVNWASKRIAYTSMSSGDLDLWSMDFSGHNKTQITTTLGYDGGAFFSRDGSKLVWRAHHPSETKSRQRYRNLLDKNLTAPMKMELFVADTEEVVGRQITSFGCAAFAPQFTPDAKRIIFSSNKNKCDSREFELFIVDVDGSNLEQVTNFGGFTSFAEFSPDGLKIVFTSSYNAHSPYEFNIFIADWNPAKGDYTNEKSRKD